MLRRHIACQRNSQAARLLCNKCGPEALRLGMKTETVIFGYRESFSKFYRNLDLNGDGYRKYGNEIGRKNRNRKRKWFRLFPTVSGNYRFYPVFYCR
jgi:hypothetical protein